MLNGQISIYPLRSSFLANFLIQDVTEEMPLLPLNGFMKITSLTKPVLFIKLEDTTTESHATNKSSAEIVCPMKVAGLKKERKSTELTNTELSAENKE
jgi:hypothetical protein